VHSSRTEKGDEMIIPKVSIYLGKPLVNIHLEAVATMRGNVEEVAIKNGFDLIEDRDDLDLFYGALLQLDCGQIFSIHARPDTKSLYFAIQLPIEKNEILSIVASIVKAINMKESDVAGINLDYFRMHY
jgi:hypothetical protein